MEFLWCREAGQKGQGLVEQAMVYSKTHQVFTLDCCLDLITPLAPRKMKYLIFLFGDFVNSISFSFLTSVDLAVCIPY